jgi:hypothetical protein
MGRAPWTALVAIAALLAPASPAGAEVLFEQGPSTFGFHPTSQDFEASLDEDDALAADDFRVPRGQVWQIERAFIDGRKPFDSEPGTTNSVNALLFAGNGSFPAPTPFYSRQLTSAASTAYPDFDLALPGVPLLPARTWWIGAQARLAFNPGADADPATVGSYWVWGTDADQVGNPAAWRNPGGGFGICEEFGLMSDCADRPGSDVTNPDLSFRLEGRRASGVFKVVAGKALKGGKLALTVNAPNLGRLKVSGTAVKPAGVRVTKLGNVKLGLKPTAATKRKLANGRRPKANLTLTLPPYFDGTKLKARFQKTLKP